MKKIILFCLLALCLTISCSKKDKDKEDVSGAKTVDLGETTANEGAEQGDEPVAERPERKRPDRDKAKRPRPSRGNDLDKDRPGEGDRDADRKDDEAANHADSPSKRGKPAAEPDAAEVKADSANQNADNQNAAETADDGFDFADEETPKAPQIREVKPKAPLNIEKYINIREFRELSGFAGALSEDYLLGHVSDSRYTAARLAPDDSSMFGFSIQVWKPGNESAASKRFSDLFSQSFGGSKLKNVANDAFVSKHHKIVELGFFEKGKRATVLLSCSEEICTQEQLKDIALVIQRRL